MNPRRTHTLSILLAAALVACDRPRNSTDGAAAAPPRRQAAALVQHLEPTLVAPGELVEAEPPVEVEEVETVPQPAPAAAVPARPVAKATTKPRRGAGPTAPDPNAVRPKDRVRIREGRGQAPPKGTVPPGSQAPFPSAKKGNRQGTEPAGDPPPKKRKTKGKGHPAKQRGQGEDPPARR